MMSGRKSVLWGVVVLTLGLSACGSSSGGKKTDFVGRSCVTDGDCSGGFCLKIANKYTGAPTPGFCSMQCKTDDECEAVLELGFTSCGMGPDGKSVCLKRCNDGPYGTPEIACIDGKSVACPAVPDGTQCSTCGCPEGKSCNFDGTCITLGKVGDVCKLNTDCESLHCGQSGRCNVSLFSSCTASDCDLCVKRPDGSTFCSTGCDSTGDCIPERKKLSDPVPPSGECLTNYCQAPCDDGCSGKFAHCRTAEYIGSTWSYCDCTYDCGFVVKGSADAGAGDAGASDAGAGDGGARDGGAADAGR